MPHHLLVKKLGLEVVTIFGVGWTYSLNRGIKKYLYINYTNYTTTYIRLFSCFLIYTIKRETLSFKQNSKYLKPFLLYMLTHM